MEDVGLLIELLERYNTAAESPSTETLRRIFTELELERIPRTSELVKRARAMGEVHAISGVEACIARNNATRQLCQDPEGTQKRFGV